MRSFLIITILCIIIFPTCRSESPNISGAQVPSHELWTKLLTKYVDRDGNVNYAGFLRDSVELNNYLNILTHHAPDKEKWSRENQIAYWINVYNAFTIKLILDHYPVKSIKDIGTLIQIPFINSPWDIKLIEIAGQKYDLNYVEHSILRKDFDEPRIHFAIVCASFSCPRLRREAYTAENLETQLQEQAIGFINDPIRNKISKKQAELSKIFSWFRSDFTKNGGLEDFLNQYSATKVDHNAKISFMDYNWALNEMSAAPE